MKKTAALILAAVMLTGLCACQSSESSTGSSESASAVSAGTSQAPSPTAGESSAVSESSTSGESSTSDENSSSEKSESTAQVETTVKGEMRDFGRFQVLIPEGWAAADLGEADADYNCVLLKGSADDFGKVPQVSVMYFLPTALIFSGKTMYSVPRDLGEFDLGAFHWETWTAISDQNLVVNAAESFGDFGAVFVNLMQVNEDGEAPDFDDPDVRAILASIVVEPKQEVDWVSIDEKGVLTANLPSEEGYEWKTTGTMANNDVEAEGEVQDNKLIITASAGNGVFKVDLELEDEENAVLMGEAEIAVMITDGKVDYLIEAVKNMKDAPQDNSYEPEPLDYEALDALYAGIWVDNNNGLTMFIQPDEETEHGYLVVLQGTDREMSAAAHIEESGKLVYEKLAFNSVDAVASTGWFVPDGTLLIWGHDEAAGSFENITVFVKIGEL